jgi:hypothetical protein
VDEPAGVLAKLELHQLRGGLVPLVRAEEAVAQLDPDTPTRAPFVERQGMDCVVRKYMGVDTTLTGSVA